MPWIAPSILSADFASLGKEVAKMEEAGARLIHIDVMDGHFVPNLTIGAPVVKALRRTTELLLDVHLMISNPENFVDEFVEAGADFLTVHFETSSHLDRLLEKIKEKGAHPGVAINPQTPVTLLEDILYRCHHVLVMSVNPGFGGQQFLANSLEKVRKLKTIIQAKALNVRIEIDGGIGPENISQAIESGVDIVVAGSSIFHSHSPRDAFSRLQQLADESAAARSRYLA